MKKLNLACGDSKISGYINVDGEQSITPDVVADLKKPLPFPNEKIEEILLFHAIEHIEEKYHLPVLLEFWRVLIPSGMILISYPEFEKIANNYLTNYRGMRDFWKHTIYGLQRYPGDYHVSLMNTKEFVGTLKMAGFDDIQYKSEPNQEFNTIIFAKKSVIHTSYEDLIRMEVLN